MSGGPVELLLTEWLQLKPVRSFKETNTTGRAVGKGGRPVLKKNELPNEKDDTVKGTEWAKEKKEQ